MHDKPKRPTVEEEVATIIATLNGIHRPHSYATHHTLLGVAIRSLQSIMRLMQGGQPMPAPIARPLMEAAHRCLVDAVRDRWESVEYSEHDSAIIIAMGRLRRVMPARSS